jgi:DNA polymerase I-like protein with 3'-5' exonuclease and polymerase domains
VSLELPTSLPWVTLDTETSGLHPDDGARVACVALAHGDWSIALPFDQGVRDKLPTVQLDLDLFGEGIEDPNLPVEDWEYLLRWCLDQRLVFQNAKYDLMMMRAGTRHWPGADLIAQFYWDTMLAQGVLDPLHPRGLDETAERLGFGGKEGLEALQGWLVQRKFPKKRYDLAPWSLVRTYVTADAVKTAQVFSHQRDRLPQRMGEAEERIFRQFDLTRALYGMEQRGIAYDDVKSLEAAEKLESEADRIEAEMPFRCVPTAAHNYFYGQLKLQAPPDKVSEKTGRPSLDEEVVRQWVKDGVPWASEYAQVTKYRRAVSMWYRGYPEKIGMDGRLRCTFKQGDVKSGRMSVERVQLQAIPKKDKNIEGIPGVRELIRAEEGHGLWNIDLGQAELRVATRYSHCQRMAELLADGHDAHGETTKQVLHVNPDDPLWKEKRDIAKRLNFGGIFQIGGEKFQATLAKLADIHLPVAECEQYVRGWRSMYPEFGVAYRKADRMAQTKKHVRLLPNTRYEVLSHFKEYEYSNTAWNRIVQGSLAEAFGIWLGEIEKRWPGYMILTVHDSIVLEALLDEGDELARDVAAFGEEMMSELFDTEMKVDIDVWKVAA